LVFRHNPRTNNLLMVYCEYVQLSYLQWLLVNCYSLDVVLKWIKIKIKSKLISQCLWGRKTLGNIFGMLWVTVWYREQCGRLTLLHFVGRFSFWLEIVPCDYFVWPEPNHPMSDRVKNKNVNLPMTSELCYRFTSRQ
jgi:hypothetical protein